MSKRPLGYIQSFFVNFWRTNKTPQERKDVLSVAADVSDSGNRSKAKKFPLALFVLNQIITSYLFNISYFVVYLTEEIDVEEATKLSDWLRSNRGPPARIFEVLNQTYSYRKSYLKGNVASSDVVRFCPRLFDIDGAVSCQHRP